jgi:transforming growth factor-beta-induced protein
MNRVVSTCFTLTLLGMTATPALADGRRPGTSTLAEIVIASPDHTVLEFALDAAGLTGALDDPHSRLTLFAPTDGAFAKAASELGFASVTDLAEYLVDEELLDDVLLFHVTEGRRFSERLFGRRSAKAIPTLISQYLVSIPGLRIVDGTIATSDARVTQANLSARNGVLHVIDNVLVP